MTRIRTKKNKRMKRIRTRKDKKKQEKTKIQTPFKYYHLKQYKYAIIFIIFYASQKEVINQQI